MPSLKIATWNANGQSGVNNGLVVISLIFEAHLTNLPWIRVRNFSTYNCLNPSNNARLDFIILICNHIKHEAAMKIQKTNTK